MKKTITNLGLITICLLTLACGSIAAQAQSYSFGTDLSLGSSGQDVASLQTWLISNGFDIPALSKGLSEKGYFGTQTQAALMNYQRSVGLPAYGFFGPMTRGRLNGDENGNSFRITSPNGGEVWQRGTTQNITWTDSNGALGQTGDVRLEFPTPACAEPGQPVRCMIMVRAPITIATHISLGSDQYSWPVGSINGYVQGGTNCDPVPVGYTAGPCPQPAPAIPDGQYKIQICPNDGSQCAESANLFTIISNGNPTSSNIIVTSPAAGVTWQADSDQTITWNISSNSSSPISQVDLYLYSTCPLGATCDSQYPPTIQYVLDRNIPGQSYGWIAATDINNNPIPAGSYAVKVCAAGSMTNCGNSLPFNLSGTAYPVVVCPAGYVCTLNH